MPSNRQVTQILAYGANLRDVMLWKEPTLAGAMHVYEELASSREWTVSGKIKPASRAVEFFNNTRSPDLSTGLYTTGLDEALRRRSLDNGAVGRIAYLNRTVPGQSMTRLEYLDPTILRFSRPSSTKATGLGKAPIKPVGDDELCWQYNGEEFKFSEVNISHPIPIGSKGLFIAPLTSLVPMMGLAYLVNDHDATSLDGRRIRDLILVASDNVQTAIISAILTQVALWAGEDPTKVGVPVVSLNSPSGLKVQDLIATLSLSKLPEDFNREQFMFTYVNQIAALLGLALRQFWNSEKTTNKALEEVQEQRQQHKGPAEFVNTEQRIINRWGILKQFGKVRFGFIEETDTQSQLVNAQVLKATAEALAQIQTVFGATISVDSMLAWMQSIHVLPNDLQLISGAALGTNINPDDAPAQAGDSTVSGDPSPSPLAASDQSKGLIPDYDEVTLNSKGEVVDRRLQVFTAAKYLAAQVEHERVEEAKEIEESSFDDVVRAQQLTLPQQILLRYHANALSYAEAEVFYSSEVIEAAVQRCVVGDIDSNDFPIFSALLEETTEA